MYSNCRICQKCIDTALDLAVNLSNCSWGDRPAKADKKHLKENVFLWLKKKKKTLEWAHDSETKVPTTI